MFEIIHIKLFDGNEYKVLGNCQTVHLEWKYTNHGWDLLFFDKLETGVNSCFKHLSQELPFSIWTDNKEFREFELDAYRKCKNTPAD